MRTPFNTGWSFRPKHSSFLELIDRSAAPEPVALPHDAMITLARDPSASHANAYFPGGIWAYETSLTAPEAWADRRVRMQFEGVYRGAMVYVNNDFAGNEPHGYGEFTVDLDPHLVPGEEHTITVECRAGDDGRWYSGGGIIRPVHLWIQPLVHLEIDGVGITTPAIDADLAVVEIAAEVRNDTHRTVTVRCETTIRDANGTAVGAGSVPVTVRPRTTVVGRHRIHVERPALWHPDHPTLHTATTTLTSEDGEELEVRETSFGIRELRVDPRRGLRINGETVKLRGACVHHDNGPIGAATIGRAEERRVELLREAGFNALRSAHNPMSRAMLDACDRLGVLVMDEAYDMWTEAKTVDDHANRFPDRWRRDIEAMVRKDRNHPSVVMYSTGNEIPEVGSPLGAAWGRALAEEIRSHDSTRFTTTAIQPVLAIRDLISNLRSYASEEDLAPPESEPGAAMGVNTMMSQWTRIKDKVMISDQVTEVIEEIAASVDIAGYNYLDNRYDLDRTVAPERVIVGSETYASVIGHAWPLIERSDHVIGDFTWTGWDYLGEVGIGRTTHAGDEESDEALGVAAPYPWIVALTGDIDITGHRRPQSFYREIVFGLRTDPYIAVQRPSTAGRALTYSGPWSWPDVLSSWTWTGAEGRELEVHVYSDADEVELLHNGSSVGRAPASREHGYQALFSLAYQPGELTAISYRGGDETGRTTLQTARDDVALCATPDRLTLIANDTDLCHIDLAIADSIGGVDPGLDRLLTATIRGPAVLQAFASSDPATTEAFTDPTCTTHDGRAIAVIRPTAAGEVTVEFRCDGFEPATVDLTISSATAERTHS